MQRYSLAASHAATRMHVEHSVPSIIGATHRRQGLWVFFIGTVRQPVGRARKAIGLTCGLPSVPPIEERWAHVNQPIFLS